MVKVLRCYNFKSQTILPVSKEPLVLSSGKDKVFIATCDCFIEVFSLAKKGGWKKYCSFQTGASVLKIEYNRSGGYVAALECKKSRKSRLWDVISVKVYLNWSIGHDQSDYRTRVRVAGLGYRSSNVETGNHLEVIDIPSEEPQNITTCQETGNLCVITGGTVKVYRLVEKNIPNSYTTFHDMEMFLHLSFELPVSLVSLCEDYLACCTVDTAQVFQISYSDSVAKPRSKTADSQTGRGSSAEFKKRLSSVVSSSLMHQDSRELGTSTHDKIGITRQQSGNKKYSLIGDKGSSGSSTPSPALSGPSRDRTSLIEDDVDFIEWSFNTRPSLNTSGTLPPSSTTTISLPGLSDLCKVKLVEPPLPSVKDLRGGLHQTLGKLTLKQVLFKYLDQSDHSWAHLQFIPTYLTGTETVSSQSDLSIPVHSCRRQSICGMCCMISGSRTGFMYSLLPETLLLSTYKYTTDISQIHTNGRLLYVMMENSLETYTARCQIIAVHNTQAFDNVTKACPAPEFDTCMCGVQQFPGAKHMTMTGNHIILLTKLTDHDSSLVWNVYAVEESSAADLYRDMIVFGTRHQLNSADTYHHLLTEGHMVLRSALIGHTLKEGEESVIRGLMLESCALLGDFYALPNCVDWMLCLPYYIMSGLSPVDVVRQAVQYKQHCKQADASAESYGKGLVQYVRYVLFNGEDPLDIKQNDGDSIITVCSEVIPELLPDIILFSRLRRYTPDFVYHLLQESCRSRNNNDSKTVAKNLLATASINLQMCEPDLALASVNKIDQKDLVNICITHHQVLHVDFMELSPFSQLMRCHNPKLLIKLLVMLLDNRVITLDLAVKLLQGKSSESELHKNTHVRSYLEMVINDEGRRLIFDDATTMLCDIYLKKLKEWEPPTCRELTQSANLRLPQGNGHFGRRHLWLDDMPPFTGTRSIQQTCKYLVPAGYKAGKQPHQLLQCQKADDIKCTCFLCNEDLLKLQSLLCSSYTTSHLASRILSLLENLPDLTGYHSLYILCMIHVNIDCATGFVIDKFPQILARFGSVALKDSYKKWDQLLKTLLLKVRQKNDSIEYKSTLKEVLSEMAGIFSPQQFLQLLPADGNFYFFMPYIQLSRDKNLCHLIGQTVISKGETLQCCC